MFLHFVVNESSENPNLMKSAVATATILRWARGILLSLVVFGVVGCSSPKEKALKELERLGVAADASSVILAARNGDLGTLNLLSTAGVDVVKDPTGKSSPLIVAIVARSGAVNYLLNATPVELIDAADEHGRTALSYAVSQAMPEVATALLGKSANPAATKHGEVTIIADALKQAQPELVAKLIEQTPEGSELLSETLLSAVKETNADAVAALLAKKASPNLRAADGDCILEIASSGGDLAIVDLLVNAGAKHDPSAPKAGNPLSYAVQRNNVEMAKLLLKAGCKPETKDREGGTPTGLAATLCRIPILDLFLKGGVSAQPHLASALVVKDFAVADLLLQHGADLNVPDASGNPPLVQAALKKDAEYARYLLDKGAAKEVRGADGQTAFSLAVISGDLPLVKTFLEAGVNANEPFAAPPTESFLTKISDDYFKKWLNKDANLTPLMFAASGNHLELMKLLMNHGAKRGSQTKSWKRYPVNFACEQSHIPAAQLLLGRDLEKKRDVKVIVSLSKQRAYIYKEGEVVRSTGISSGRKGFSTPSGQYVISDKQAHWISSIYKVPMPYFMRLSCRDFGLHAGIVTGRPASHGCVRLPKAEAQAFFALMEIGDPVTIEN